MQKVVAKTYPDGRPMFLWWRDVVIEGVYKGDHTPVVQLSLRYGMILFIASEVMFFVAWFWAYFDVSLFPADVHKIADGLQVGVVGRDQVLGGKWPPIPTADGTFRHTFDPWELPLFNTLVLLTSATTVTWAHHSLIHVLFRQPALRRGRWGLPSRTANVGLQDVVRASLAKPRLSGTLGAPLVKG